MADLQNALREEQIIVEEKKVQTDELIVSIGKEKAVVDEAVEAGREDEEAASKLAEEVLAFQDESSRDLEAGALAALLSSSAAPQWLLQCCSQGSCSLCCCSVSHADGVFSSCPGCWRPTM